VAPARSRGSRWERGGNELLFNWFCLFLLLFYISIGAGVLLALDESESLKEQRKLTLFKPEPKTSHFDLPKVRSTRWIHLGTRWERALFRRFLLVFAFVMRCYRDGQLKHPCAPYIWWKDARKEGYWARFNSISRISEFWSTSGSIHPRVDSAIFLPFSTSFPPNRECRAP